MISPSFKQTTLTAKKFTGGLFVLFQAARHLRHYFSHPESHELIFTSPRAPLPGLTCWVSQELGIGELSCKDTGRAAPARPAAHRGGCCSPPPPRNHGGRGLPRFSAPRTPRAAGAGTVSPVGRRSETGGDSLGDSLLRQADLSPLPARAAGHRAKKPGAS